MFLCPCVLQTNQWSTPIEPKIFSQIVILLLFARAYLWYIIIYRRSFQAFLGVHLLWRPLPILQRLLKQSRPMEDSINPTPHFVSLSLFEGIGELWARVCSWWSSWASSLSTWIAKRNGAFSQESVSSSLQFLGSGCSGCQGRQSFSFPREILKEPGSHCSSSGERGEMWRMSWTR